MDIVHDDVQRTERAKVVPYVRDGRPINPATLDSEDDNIAVVTGFSSDDNHHVFMNSDALIAWAGTIADERLKTRLLTMHEMKQTLRSCALETDAHAFAGKTNRAPEAYLQRQDEYIDSLFADPVLPKNLGFHWELQNYAGNALPAQLTPYPLLPTYMRQRISSVESIHLTGYLYCS